MILDPGFNLTLRPMKYPAFYEQYRNAIKNTWTVEEVDLFSDIADLNQRLTPAERHLINRLVAFFATGDSIVSNNLVLNLYKHINSPEARMYLSRKPRIASLSLGISRSNPGGLSGLNLSRRTTLMSCPSTTSSTVPIAKSHGLRNWR